ncbi:MAG: peptidylprolyl isomerase [Rhodospirillales bacterium]
MAMSLFPQVSVNGVVLPALAIATEAQNHPAAKPGWAWKAAARALVVRELLRQEAEAGDIAADARELAPGRFESKEEARLRALLEAKLTVGPPSEAQLRVLYDRDPGRYRAPDLFEAAHILFAVPTGDETAAKKAGQRAEAALKTLQQDASAFDVLAKSESDCASAAKGGRLGQIVQGETEPAFEAALTVLTPGEIAPTPVETSYGLHIVRLDAVARGAVLPFSAVRKAIAEKAEKRAWARAARRYVGDLVAAADIEGVAFEAALQPAASAARGP